MVTKLFSRFSISSLTIIALTAVFWMAFANISFFRALLSDYPLNGKNAFFLATITFGFTAVIIIILALFCFRRTTKPILIALLIVSSLAAYFMDTYNIPVDDSMIITVLQTNAKEAGDLFSLTMIAYLLLLGILPSLLVYQANITFSSLRYEIITRVRLITSLFFIVLILFFFQSAEITSFFREHKSIRFYSNPASYVFGIGKSVRNLWRSAQGNQPLVILGKDAAIPETDVERELIILVVGETARADRFSLNGYEKKTNPLLEKQGNLVSFTHVTSCATLTAISVPCMFSIDAGDNFDTDKAKHKENVLDVLKHAGIQVLWRDNNSSSKGVADRVIYQDYRDPNVNPVCDIECRDEGMLVGLQDYINAQKKGDILIVLHQMGNHGPAYYKRYPEQFEHFKPACHTNELADCSKEEINNAYDNAILYTDYFLSKVVELLKQNDSHFETAMIYVSDHGESLGENGLYLHGLPNLIAPETQRHIPLIMWAGENMDELDIAQLRAKKGQPLKHENVFHALLGLMEIESTAYNETLDFIKH